MSKYTKHQLVEIKSGYLRGEIFEVIDISSDSAGTIYRLVGGKDQGETRIYRYERELSPRYLTELTAISQTIDDQQQQMKELYASVSNITPSLYSFAELMNKIKHGKLDITFI